MDIVVKKLVARKIGYKEFVSYGVSAESWSSWREDQVIKLGDLAPNKLDTLEALFQKYKGVRGVQILLQDIASWRKALEGGAASMKARTVRQFRTLLERYLLDVPGPRLYKRHDEGAMLVYYVNEVSYNPPIDRGGSRRPANVEMELVYEAIGGLKEDSICFHYDECCHITVAKVLADKGYTIEDDRLRQEYLATKELYVKVAGQVGKQYWARGKAVIHDETDNYWRSRKNEVPLDRDGEASRVVVDVFYEDGKPDRDRRVDLNRFFWKNVQGGNKYDRENDIDEDEDFEEDEDTGEVPDVEIPIHPWVIIFHLQKHLRLKAHVDQLEEYVYDERLADKLVLPADQKNLVKLLIDTKGGAFQDIVQGKGGGAVVLLTGEPGTGKTLTAEVYAESEKRALYSVQCSQLGVKPEELEEALMVIFDRAKRWNAVMLLDEADVYVHERGNSMSQNAIVGVFLRVLEYQSTILFLTSNRPEDVDDAISSRCIARLHYVPPNSEDATKIWQVLSQNAGIKVIGEVIATAVQRNPAMTGRDIKNILKLGALMDGAQAGLTVEMIEYVQQFKPTGKRVINLYTGKVEVKTYISENGQEALHP